MADITKALSAKANKILNKYMRYESFGILTRRQFCEKMLEIGAIPEIGQVPRVQWNSLKAFRMDYKEYKEYELLCSETKTEYWLNYPDEPGSCSVVTKTEYDYFMELLSEKQDREELSEFNALPVGDRHAIESLFTGSYKA